MATLAPALLLGVTTGLFLLVAMPTRAQRQPRPSVVSPTLVTTMIGGTVSVGPRRTLGRLREYFRGAPVLRPTGGPAHHAVSGPAEGRFLSRRGTVLFVVMGIIWGIPYLLIKVADGAVAVPVLVWSRVVIGALILVPVALAQGAGGRPSARYCAGTGTGWLRMR